MPTLNAISDLRNRPQAWKAYKRILQYAHAQGLKKGDRLPLQPQIRQALGICANTHGAAMAALVADGVLTAKRGVGTVLADTQTINRVPWTIGAASIRSEAQAFSAFTSDLFVRIQAALGRAGCRCVMYHRSNEWTNRSRLKELVGLEEDLAAGDMDGLVTLTPIGYRDWNKTIHSGVPICHSHWWEDAPCGVLVDQGAWVEQAVAMLAGRGCRRLAAAANRDRKIETSYFWESFDRAVALAGLPREAGETLVIGKNLVHDIAGIEEIAPRLARSLLGRAPQDRPDGLVIADDYIASNLAMILREAGDYRPMMAVQTNRQQPRLFALPILAFEVDIEALAQQTVDLLLERVRNPAAAQRVEWHVPQLAQSESRLSPMLSVG